MYCIILFILKEVTGCNSLFQIYVIIMSEYLVIINQEVKVLL